MFNKKRIARLTEHLDNACQLVRDLTERNHKLREQLDAFKPSKFQYEISYWTLPPERIVADGYMINDDKSATFFKVLGSRSRRNTFRMWQSIKSIRVVEIEEQ